MNLISFFAFSVMLLATSCAMIPQNEVKPTELIKGSSLQKAQVVEVEVKTYGARIGPDGYIYPVRDESSYDHLQGIKKLKSFTICKTSDCSGNKRKILIDFYFWRESPLMALISGLTLTIIPVREKERFLAKAIVFDENGEPLKNYKFEDRIHTWFQLFLIFGLPFQDFDLKDKVAKNILNRIIAEAKADGLI